MSKEIRTGGNNGIAGSPNNTSTVETIFMPILISKFKEEIGF